MSRPDGTKNIMRTPEEKEKLFLDFNVKQTDNVEQAIKDYVYYYNNDRSAYSLKYKTPTQFKSELESN